MKNFLQDVGYYLQEVGRYLRIKFDLLLDKLWVEAAKLNGLQLIGIFAIIAMLLVLMVILITPDHSSIITKVEPVKQEKVLAATDEIPAPNTSPFPTEKLQLLATNRSALYPSYPLSVEKDEMKCLAMNIYYEARNQSVKGQYAVAFVTLNRIQDPRWPNNVCDVVYQKRWSVDKQGFVAQFSWINCARCTRPRDKKNWQLAQNIAENTMKLYGTSLLADPSLGATHYHATYVSPRWRLRFQKTVKIETHIFYKTA